MAHTGSHIVVVVVVGGGGGRGKVERHAAFTTRKQALYLQE